MPSRPKPSHLKVVSGTERKNRRNDREPQLPTTAPPRPPGLNAAERRLWKRYVELLLEMGVLTVADGPALQQLVVIHAEADALKRTLDVEGHTYRVKSTQGDVVSKQNPAVVMYHSARAQLVRYQIEFGLTPAARTKVHTVSGSGNRRSSEKPPEAAKPAESYFG